MPSAVPFAPVAQLDRAPGYEPGGRGFEFLRAHHFTSVAKANSTRQVESDSIACRFQSILIVTEATKSSSLAVRSADCRETDKLWTVHEAE
jgi:hypothetical protein